MTVHTSQGIMLEAPQRVWVIDEHLYSRVEYLSQFIRIESPPLPPEIVEARNKKAIEQSLRPFISGKLIGYMDQDKKKDWDEAENLDLWTVDRINNELGHIEGNVQLTCLEYNYDLKYKKEYDKFIKEYGWSLNIRQSYLRPLKNNRVKDKLSEYGENYIINIIKMSEAWLWFAKYYPPKYIRKRLLKLEYEINSRDYWENFVFRVENDLTTHKKIGNDPKYRNFKVQLALHKENHASLII
ncbi:hypothetical protein Glove_74g89 [Diversispora epigaea]|uniref:Uncharacterized protein n=1 Tax=Diversispora epigaea TaxID=1348612 RepID=A0A397JI59_9GLOM|nr:hypothetical protein Glove_74g89 [Diversispora epigaea]